MEHLVVNYINSYITCVWTFVSEDRNYVSFKCCEVRAEPWFSERYENCIEVNLITISYIYILIKNEV